MEEQFDYLKEYCDSEKTKSINAKLLAMYKKWYESWYKGNESRYASFSTSCKGHPDEMVYLNKPLLLTCTDAYLENRVILFGKEAHDTDSSISCFRCELDHYYDSSTYKYDRAIRFDEREAGKKKAPNREFLKIRKICAELKGNTSFKDRPDDFRIFTGVLVNNLNKVSYGGNKTPVEDSLGDIYKDFRYDIYYNDPKNVFFYEFSILEPKKVLFLCGDYIEHLNRDFGSAVAQKLEASWKTLSTKEGSLKLVSDPDTFQYAGNTVEYVYGYHPSYPGLRKHLKIYEDAIERFIKC